MIIRVGIVAALVMLRQAINVEYAYEALVGAYVISLFVALKTTWAVGSTYA